MRALVADADLSGRRTIGHMLEKRGHEVTVVASGREAWDQFVAVRPTIVVVDWMLPDLPGTEICRMIRAHGDEPYAYVILLAALAGRGSLLEAFRSGADEYLTKPFDTEELAARIGVGERILGTLQQRTRTLEGFLSVCMYCSKIKDRESDWMRIDDYVAAHTDAMVSHGMCGECYASRFPQKEDE